MFSLESFRYSYVIRGCADKTLGAEMPTPIPLDQTTWNLPPLILHPFNEHIPPSVLLDNSKAALMLSGLIPSDGTDPDELGRRIMTGRYGEIRMLYFLGKDILRWLEQCIDWATREPELERQEWRAQSFAEILTSSAPDEVREKLSQWGVTDYASIFRRAIGLNALFATPPEFGDLAEEFLRNYHRYADSLYRSYMEMEPGGALDTKRLTFGLYASGEYSRMLESQWEEGE
jgi:hypothetical protein